MMIIQHRANDHKQKQTARFAEVDVWVCDDGRLRLKHDVKGDKDSAPPIDVETFLSNATWEKYFVNVKQSLSIEDYYRIADEFDGKLIGLFDIPMPSAYVLSIAASFPIYERVSEYEGGLRTGHAWIDPLNSLSLHSYAMMFGKALEMQRGADLILACPSLHGGDLKFCQNVWSWLKFAPANPIGIVTKFPEQAAEVLGD